MLSALEARKKSDNASDEHLQSLIHNVTTDVEQRIIGAAERGQDTLKLNLLDECGLKGFNTAKKVADHVKEELIESGYGVKVPQDYVLIISWREDISTKV